MEKGIIVFSFLDVSIIREGEGGRGGGGGGCLFYF